MASDVEVLAHDPEIRPLLYEQTEGGERLRTYLTRRDRESWEADLAQIEAKLNDPTERKQITNLGRITQQYQQRKRMLDRQIPPPLTNSQRDKLVKLEAAAEASFREGMVSDEEMRRRTAGAVDDHMAWEQAKKRDVLIWKSARKLVHQESLAPNLTNHERFRPERPTANLHLADAQIPGIFAMTSPLAKAGWDETFEQKDWTDPAVRRQFVETLKAHGIEVKFRSRPLRDFSARHVKGQGPEERLKAQAKRDEALLIGQEAKGQ